METENLIRQCCKLHSRLFNHRPFISTEIHLMCSEFETKRNDREVRNLNGCLTSLAHVCDQQIPATALLLRDHVPGVVGSVSVASRMMEKVAEKQENNPLKEVMARRQQQRMTAWNVYMEGLCEESHQIERDYEEGKQRIDAFYQELEKDLKIENRGLSIENRGL